MAPRRDEAEDSDMDEDEDDPKKIEEEFELWKKHTPYLYDLILANTLLWPSLTVQWLPGREVAADRDCSRQRLILGTHTSGNHPDCLMIAEVLLPLPDAELPEDVLNDERTPDFGFATAERRMSIVQRINHEGEVNKARFMPQDPDLIATKANSGEVHVWSCKAQAANPQQPGVARPDVRLGGHKMDGFGLSWSPHDSGHVASGSNDAQVCVWDINAPAKGKKLLEPTATFHHEAEVNDVAWHPFERSIVGSVGDDKQLILWDTRQAPDQACVASAEGKGTCLAFHPRSTHLLVTGAPDSNVSLWDSRNLSAPLHCMDGHKGDVIAVSWSPHCEPVLMSAGTDRRVLLWDISRIGDEQAPEDGEDGPPELLFVHAGHRSSVPDMSWHPEDPWVIASVGEGDNCAMIWKAVESTYAEDA